MSPVTSIDDPKTFNIQQQSNMIVRNSSKSDCENLHMLTKRKSIPFDEYEQSKRRFIVTNISTPETIRQCSIDNQLYDNSMIRKSSTTQNMSTYQQLPHPKLYRIPSSSTKIEIKSMDFRPLIINGRRKLGAIPSSSSMIIIKKKSSIPLNNISYNQKPSIRSIPVDIINSNMAIVVSSMIPSSLSYSSSYSSSSSTSAVSTNVGTVFLPIQVTKSQKNNNNHITYSANNTVNDGQQGYRYVQKPIDQQTSFVYLNTGNRTQLNDDINQSKKISSSSSISEEGCKYKSTIMMDSNVLRLIRRYDPVASSTTTRIIPRRSLENTRGVWHTVASKTATSEPSDSSPFLSRRSLTTTFEDEIPVKQQSTPRLQRQHAIQESEPPPPPPTPINSIRPILKYTSSRARSEFIVQPHQTEPLTIKIDPYIPPPSNESPATYQPLITTGTKRVCSALSKSEWDLRLQQEQLPIQPSSPSSNLLNQQQEKESYRPSLIRSQSSTTLNHNNNDQNIDDIDEISAPIIPTGSCVEKLKQLFVTKSSFDITNPSLNNHHRNDSIDSNLNRRINLNNQIDRSSSIIKPTLIETQTHIIHKPTPIIQEVTPIYKKPIFRSQKTIDSPESVNRSNNSVQIPSTEFSFDAYRFRPLNNQDSIGIRPKNIAKVEPYSMNTNTVRPLYQTTTETTVVPSKARINLNSLGNTPINSSTSSSAGSLGGVIRHSDFLLPNPTYSKPLPNVSSYATSPILLSESLSHQLSTANVPSSNGHTTGLISSKNTSQEKYQSSIQGDFHSSLHTSSPSYQYRPIQTNNQQQSEIPICSKINEKQDELINDNQQQQQQSRRRFQRRKQMKRSKSVDSYQDPSAFISPIINNDLNKSYRQPRSTSREQLESREILLSPSSSSSSSTADIERINQAALLRYKSLDSITFNNRKSNLNGKNINNNRRIISKPTEFDFDSDDSVCGIPKPRKLCTSSKNAAKSDRTLLDSSSAEKDHHENTRAISIHTIGSSGTSTGITNSVRKHGTTNDQTYSMVESTPSTTKTLGEKREGENIVEQSGIAFVESQFYARTSNTPYLERHDFNDKKDTIDDLNKIIPTNLNEEKKFIESQKLFINEPIDINSSMNTRSLSNTIIINPFERLRPMDIEHRSEELSLQVFDQPSFPVDKDDLKNENSSKLIHLNIIQDQFDENNDSSTSTTTNRSVHLPVEKQRGLSEIIRKRNSKCKVEDYKRSIQKPNTIDEQESLPILKNDDELMILSNNSTSPPLDINPKYFEIPINIQNNDDDERVQASIERLNLLLTKDEEQERDRRMSVADKKSLFETISKDTQFGGTLPRSKSFKHEDSPSITKKYTNGNNQHLQTENILQNNENETFDDDISKLSFKEKMILFNKKKPTGLTPTSSLKNNRNRLTQPITAEEVQAAANLTPPSSKKQLSDSPEESENIVPVSKRLEQFKAVAEIELKPSEKSRKTPTLKYNAKKTNTDQQNRAKTVDIVRLKTSK